MRPSRYMEVTDAAIRAPRPGRFSRTCPAPGMIHANTTAGSQGVEEGASGTLEGVAADGDGVTGKAPGLSLTDSFYRIDMILRARASQTYPHTHAGAAGYRYLERAPGVGIQELQLLVVDFHGVFGSGGQAQDE